LFFRDTQAAIKGQNPSASFGEVSKIVASMWDVLQAEHKNVSQKSLNISRAIGTWATHESPRLYPLFFPGMMWLSAAQWTDFDWFSPEKKLHKNS
jgi:HMG (high mobility group) box